MQPTLLLFDIDGTLLTTGGLSKKVFKHIMLRRFPHFSNGFNIPYSGMTDPQIIETILKLNHCREEERSIQTAAVLKEFVKALCNEIERSGHLKLLPGVKHLIDYCRNLDNCYLGLVTGNMVETARAKLRAVNLYEAFPLGAFGSDRKDRNALPPLALARAQKYYGQCFEPNNIWIVGDSVRDIRCARASGIRVLAVASGVTNLDELKKEKPDYTAKNLEDFKTIVKWLGIG